MFRRLKIISVFLLLFLIFLSSFALAQTAVGKFTFVQGRVDVLRQPAPRAVPVKMGDAVFVGDIIRAKSASKAEITFKDGNIVRVAPNTRVEISEYMLEEAKGKGVLKLSRGKVQAIIQEKIAKRIATFGEANRFEIHTPTAILGVRGTNFIVLYQRNSSSVLVLEGIVLAYNPKFPDMAVTVNAGYVTTIPLDQPAQPARPFTDAEKKMYEGDFAPGGSGANSEAEDTVISEATTGPAEPGAPETGPESTLPTGNLTETPQNLTEIVQPPPITETVGSGTTPPDTTPPELTITAPKAPMVKGSGDIIVDIEASETGITYSYKLNTEDWKTTNKPQITISENEQQKGINTLEVKASDAANNTSNPISYKWFVGDTQYSLEGNVTGSISGSVLSISEGLRLVSNGNQGAWLLDYSGDYKGAIPDDLNLISGGKGYGPDSEEFNGYWLSKIEDATASGGSISGTSSFKYLSTTDLGKGIGSVSGTYGSPWQITDLGLGTYTESPLVFGAKKISGDFMYWDGEIGDMSNVGMMQGLMGGTESLWSLSDPPSFLSLGKYEGQNGNTLWGMDIGSEGTSGWTSDGGAFLGSMGGIALNDNLEGRLIAIYIRPNGDGYETGYIYSNEINGSLYPGIEMYELGGNLTAVNMGTTSVSPKYLYKDSPYLRYREAYLPMTGDIEGAIDLKSIRIQEIPGDSTSTLTWAIRPMSGGGSYESIPVGVWDAVAGNIRYDDMENIDGYTLLHMSGDTWSGGKFLADVNGKSLRISPFGDYAYISNITGSIIGTYDASYWEALGFGTSTRTPLAFGGGVGSEFFEWDPFFYLVGNRTLIGLMGGTESLWTGTSPFLSLGTYDTESLYNGALWGVDIGAEPSGFISDGGAFLGIMGGISLNDNLEGRALALYIKPNGEGYETGYILSDNVSGSLYPGIGMYELGGNLISVSMGTTSISPDNLSWDGFYGDSPSLYLGREVGTVEGDIEGSVAMQNIGLVDEDWGIWWGSGGGTFNMEGPPSTDWTANASGESYGFVYGEEGAYWDQIGYWGGRTIGTEWANGVLKGLNLGYWANTLPATGISVGEILGTFDPNAYTWQAVSMGAWIETNKFLQMAATTEGQAKLQQMNIPCVEVGRATLTGSGNNFSSLNMTDTIFFAPNSGAKPTIWATGNVNGSYSSAPTINTPVGLSGGGLNADFTFKQWDAGNGKWLSSINGTGGFNGSASFQGAGAGTLTNPSGAGTISGTAAGVAR